MRGRRPTVSLPASITEFGRGPAVVLVHGQPGLGSDWEPVASRLEDDHRVLCPDRPGYGEASLEPTSMVANADLLAAMVRCLVGETVTVVGHSYGGGIALLLAARHPELVRGLVLVGSVGRSDSVSGFDRMLTLPVVGEVLSAGGLFALGRILPALRRQVERAQGGSMQWLVSSLPDERYRQSASARGRRVWRSFVAEQRSLVREIGLVEDTLASIVVPTEVITGSVDVVVPPSVSASMAASMSGAALTVVARTGHFVPRDRPDVVAEAVRRVEARAG